MQETLVQFLGQEDNVEKRQATHIAGGFYQLRHPGKPKKTGVVSLSLLHWIFLTQKLNQGLLHYRQILYQLSY